MPKLKVSVIREEYVAITGNYKLALVLNQMIYWSERTKDFDQFITEENGRRETEGLEPMGLSQGWIYKTAKQLSEDMMTGWTEKTLRGYLKELVSFGFLHTRRNPDYKWDRTLQYRVDLNVIKQALEDQGYTLQGYRESASDNSPGSTPKPANCASGKKTGSKMQKDRIKDALLPDRTGQYAGTIPETTTKITTETTATTTPSPLPSPFSEIVPAPTQKTDQQQKVTQDTLNLIPEAYRKNIIISMVKGCALPEQVVRDCILYANRKPEKEGKNTWQAYKSYLGRTFENHSVWCPGFEQDIVESNAEAQTKSEAVASVPDGTEVEYKGKRYTVERGGFLSTENGCFPPASVAKAVQDGIILLC